MRSRFGTGLAQRARGFNLEDSIVFGLGKKTKAVVGLDIGSSAVKAVELKPAGKGFRGTVRFVGG